MATLIKVALITLLRGNSGKLLMHLICLQVSTGMIAKTVITEVASQASLLGSSKKLLQPSVSPMLSTAQYRRPEMMGRVSL